MKSHGRLLQRHSGRGAERQHDGRIAVAPRNTRWCSDDLEIGLVPRTTPVESPCCH